ncbi:hypothetical protein B0H11DRAFT_147053 [Mycena galericulata]|nr:hypothetical protein B0H11DRAFT_147053 [Mycena galericulata]
MHRFLLEAPERLTQWQHKASTTLWSRSASELVPPHVARLPLPVVAYAEHLDLDYAQSNSLSARPRPTVETPSNTFNDDDVSELISPASRMQGSTFRLSRLGEGPSRPPTSVAASRRTTFRTSYRTSFIPQSPSSPDSAEHASMRSPPRSISSNERSVDHRHSVSITTPSRWPTFNGEQFHAAGFGRSGTGRSRASSVSSPASVHRPPPLPLPSLPSAGIRTSPNSARTPPPSAVRQCTESEILHWLGFHSFRDSMLA